MNEIEKFSILSKNEIRNFGQNFDESGQLIAKKCQML